MIEWLEDHVAAICSFKLNFGLFFGSSWLTPETGRGPLVESRDPWLGRLESGLWQADTSKAVAPACVG
jgi:hypothetical protein